MTTAALQPPPAAGQAATFEIEIQGPDFVARHFAADGTLIAEKKFASLSYAEAQLVKWGWVDIEVERFDHTKRTTGLGGYTHEKCIRIVHGFYRGKGRAFEPFCRWENPPGWDAEMTPDSMENLGRLLIAAAKHARTEKPDRRCNIQVRYGRIYRKKTAVAQTKPASA